MYTESEVQVIVLELRDRLQTLFPGESFEIIVFGSWRSQWKHRRFWHRRIFPCRRATQSHRWKNWQIDEAAAEVLMNHGVVISPIVENSDYFQRHVSLLPFYRNYTKGRGAYQCLIVLWLIYPDIDWKNPPKCSPHLAAIWKATITLPPTTGLITAYFMQCAQYSPLTAKIIKAFRCDLSIYSKLSEDGNTAAWFQQTDRQCCSHSKPQRLRGFLYLLHWRYKAVTGWRMRIFQCSFRLSQWSVERRMIRKSV